MKKNRIPWKSAVHIVLILLSVMLLYHMCSNSDQVRPEYNGSIQFQGEYCQGNGGWQTLTEDTDLSALKGKLTLKGKFNKEIQAGESIWFYLNHIVFSIDINGEQIAEIQHEDMETSISMCGAQWLQIISPGIQENDEIIIHLQNEHSLGNIDAYNQFLTSIYSGSENTVEKAVEEQYHMDRLLGSFLLLLSLPLLGMSLAFLLMKQPMYTVLWQFGCLTFFAGAYLMIGSTFTLLGEQDIVFNAYAKILCLMLALGTLSLYILSMLGERIQKAGSVGFGIQALAIVIVIILSGTKVVRIYDTLPYWMWMQFLATAILLICCVYEVVKTKGRPADCQISCIILQAVLLTDLINLYVAWWPQGLPTKIVFVILCVIYLVKGIRSIPANYSAAASAARLEMELKNSRSILAMSQIRAHFIFNVLNAISGMCKYDAEKADETVVMFARFLRTNISILQNDTPVSFREALKHLEDYIALEQIRFGDKIRFEKDIQTDNFKLPSLILQPLVENAVKHGLTPIPEGGTILLRTWKDENDIFVCIHDNGAGFDPKTGIREGAVGLNNVRFRLEHIVNGRLIIESAPGKGTTVILIIPCKEET